MASVQTKAEYLQWLKKHPARQQALLDYQSGSTRINSSLRVPKNRRHHYREEYQAAKRIRRAFRRAPAIAERQLWRGICDDTFDAHSGMKKAIKKNKPFSWTEPSFTSTSRNRYVAQSFATTAVLKLTVVEPIPAIRFRWISESFHSERETLLPPGCRFTITDVCRKHGELTIVSCEVRPPL